jgi:hypothetical protein
MEGGLAVLPVYALGTTVGCYVGFWSYSRVQPRLDRWFPGRSATG